MFKMHLKSLKQMFFVVNDFCGIMNCDTFSVAPSIISDNVTVVISRMCLLFSLASVVVELLEFLWFLIEVGKHNLWPVLKTYYDHE